MKINDIYLKKYFSYFIVLFLPIIFIQLSTIFFQEKFNRFTQEIVFSIKIDILLLLILIILSLYLLKKITNMRGAEFLARKTFENLSQLNVQSRQQRHDFNNHLQTTYSLLEMNDYESAKRYFRELFFNVIKQGEFLKINNNVLAALLYAKMNIAKSKNINFTLETTGNFKNLPLDSLEITSVVGNLLDNAIDAVANNNEKERNITINLYQGNMDFIFKITNTGTIPDEIANNVFKLNYSTKGSSGLGLSTAMRIIDGYNGNIELLCSNGETIFTVYIPAIEDVS